MHQERPASPHDLASGSGQGDKAMWYCSTLILPCCIPGSVAGKKCYLLTPPSYHQCQPQNTLSQLLSVSHKTCCLSSCLSATKHPVSALVCQPQNMLSHLLSVSHKTYCLSSCLSATKHPVSALVCQPQNTLSQLLSVSHKTRCLIPCLSATKHAVSSLVCQSINILPHLYVSH